MNGSRMEFRGVMGEPRHSKTLKASFTPATSQARRPLPVDMTVKEYSYCNHANRINIVIAELDVDGFEHDRVLGQRCKDCGTEL